MTNLNRRLAADLDRAFPALVDKMQSPVFNGARRWLPSRQDAEDATQEVFVRAYRALADYPPDRIGQLNLRPWLFAITLNVCRNHARGKSRRPAEVSLGATDDAAAEETEPTAMAGLAVDEWRDRLARLTAPQREAIVLRHVVGMSLNEVAMVVGRPAGTVKSDVHRGLQRLRAMIDSEESR